MYGIEILVEEHDNILRFVERMEQECRNIIDGQPVDSTFFREAVIFARGYADSHHHGKEEAILFKVMVEKLGPVAEKLVKHGMLVEHDLGRYHLSQLLEVLNQIDGQPDGLATTEQKRLVLTHMGAWCDLLRRHIAKENTVAYTFAERSFDEQTKRQIDADTRAFEEGDGRRAIIERHLSWLNQHTA